MYMQQGGCLIRSRNCFLSVSLDCPFCIVHSVFSNVYLKPATVTDDTLGTISVADSRGAMGASDLD